MSGLEIGIVILGIVLGIIIVLLAKQEAVNGVETDLLMSSKEAK